MSTRAPGRWQRFKRHLHQRLGYWLHPRDWPPATAATIGAILVVFGVHGALFGVGDELGLFRMGAYYEPGVWSGELYRLIAPLFLHGGWLHLAVNLTAMVLICGEIERLIGTRWWLVVYYLGGVVGCALSGLVPPLTLSVGASGAIYSVIGVLLGAVFAYRDPLTGAFRLHWTLYPAALGLIAIDSIGTMQLMAAIGMTAVPDIAGHAGGLLTGLWLAHIVLPPNRSSLRAPLETMCCGPDGVWRMGLDRKKLRILGVGAVVLLAAMVYSIAPVFSLGYRLQSIDQRAFAGELAAAEAAYRALEAEGHRTPDIRLRLASVVRARGRVAEAVSLLRETHPQPETLRRTDDPLRYLGLYFPLFALRASAEAELHRHDLEGEIRAALDSPQALSQRYLASKIDLPAYAIPNDYAMVLLTLGQLEQAEQLARQAVEQHPSPVTLDTLALVLHYAGRQAEARELLLRAIAEAPIAAARYHLGLVLEAMGQREAAAHQYRLAVTLPIPDLPFNDQLDAYLRLRRLEGR